MSFRLYDSLKMQWRSQLGSRRTPKRRRIDRSSGQFSQLETRCLLAANPIISEFMAFNDGALLDENGQASDWIEIHNAGDVAVDLGGWSLTDDASDLTKWSFPTTTLGSNESLLVFASGRDPSIVGTEFHTNFRLNADGEYLALVQPDGETVAFDFGTQYPSQLEGISYGLAMETSQSVLIDDATLVRTHVPSDGSLGSSWINPSFDDSSWQGGSGITAGVGYENAPTSEFSYAPLINAPLTPSAGGISTAYARFEFNLNSVADINQLSLAMQFDDGFVAYLNGVEVASANAPASPMWNSLSTSGTPDAQVTDPIDFDLTDHVDELVVGSNVLAFQLLNRTAGSSDLLLIPELTAAQSTLVQPQTLGYFSDPTPGTSNGTNALGFTADPTFSVTRGYYDSAFSVTLTSATAEANIYYTTNGSTPSETNGTLYTGPVTIAGTTALRAVAVKGDFFPSDSVTHTYLFASDVATQSASPQGFPADWGTHNNHTAGNTPFLAVADYAIDSDVVGPNDLFNGAYTGQRFEDALTSIPTISLALDIDDAFDGDTGFYANSLRSGRAWERETSVEWWDPSEAGEFQVNAGIRAHGGVSRQPWRTPKHGLRLYFRNDYGPGRLEFPLFGDEGVTSFDRLVFRSHYNDSWQAVSSALHTRGQFIQDPFVRNSFAEMGNLSIRSRPVNVYINGLYWGVYDITERPDAEYFADHLGGNAEDFDVITARGSVQDGNRDAWDDLINLVRTTDLSTTAGYEAVKEKLDVENLVDYMLVNFYAGVDDWPHNNWVAANNRVDGGGFRFYVWDAEISMNQLDSNRTGVDDGNSSAELYDRLRANADFRQLFIDRAHLHLSDGGALAPDASIERYTELGELVKPALVAESARWGDVHPTVPLTVDNQWQNEFDWVVDTYLPQRTNIFISQLQSAGLASQIEAPSFQINGISQVGGAIQAGDVLSINSSGIVYYTLDGSDPRLAGGGVAPNALTDTSGVHLNATTNIRARVLSNGQWSAVQEATFTVSASVSELRISELHFNPAAPSASEIAAGFDDNDDFEFIEIFNPSATGSINLNGVSLSNGITFDFGDFDLLSGERAVVVEDIEAFVMRYGDNATVLGQWSGALSNGGETVTLRDSSLLEIMSVNYGDNDPWYQAADGNGFSLVLDDPINTPVDELGKHYSWRSSTFFGGTPGVAPVARAGVVVNEVLAHTDALQSDSIELFNPTNNAINVGGWYLSNEGDDLFKYQIPAAMVIAAGGYLVFDESDFNVTVNGFALSGSEGDEVYLSQAVTGTLVALQDSVEFGATFSGESLGRLPNGSGRLTRLATNSFGSFNEEAEVGPVVISEINYHPSDPSAAALLIDSTLIDNDLEYIEIANSTATPIDLTNWRIRGEADFDFAAGTVIGPREAIVVVSFDPALEPNKLAAFEAHYGISSGSTMIVGGLIGSQSNSSGRIALQQPDAPDELGNIPHVVVDEVVYDDLAPFPNADGNGQSLQRDDLAASGSFATNWLANSPTPGVFESAFLLGDTNQDGVVDFLDISPFISLLQSGAFLLEADINQDGEVDFLDISPFIDLLINGS